MAYDKRRVTHRVAMEGFRRLLYIKDKNVTKCLCQYVDKIKLI